MQNSVAGMSSISSSSSSLFLPSSSSVFFSSPKCYCSGSCFKTKSTSTPENHQSESRLTTGTTAQPSYSSRPSVIVSAFFGLGGSKDSSAKATGTGCFKCGWKGAIECPGCKGTGKNKKNGNMFERWKCYDCQGFGLVGCPKCGSGGLTPEQRGER
ncbi:hypothetical protein R1sor_005252 [Riccia sorocarpa]|uniref:Uncharacterized protein n=1 Tax=Riccia sorocarpa TaxID=122646 RepID=A0ABD3HNA3_9MARC